MSDYRRWYQPGGTYFFTVVAYRRRLLFKSEMARSLLGEVMREIARDMPFQPVAIVLLWDHLHAVWSLPPGDDDFSGRWQHIKREFTCRYLAAGGTELPVTRSQAKQGRRGVWQRRYWEHLIEDEAELAAYCEYIHYNPVKHGYVKRPWDWKPSTFRKFVAAGEYPADWGRSEPPRPNHWEFD